MKGKLHSLAIYTILKLEDKNLQLLPDEFILSSCLGKNLTAKNNTEKL